MVTLGSIDIHTKDQTLFAHFFSITNAFETRTIVFWSCFILTGIAQNHMYRIGSGDAFTGLASHQHIWWYQIFYRFGPSRKYPGRGT